MDIYAHVHKSDEDRSTQRMRGRYKLKFKRKTRRMARKKELEEQQEIPQDLSGLKRQALQKLCKSLGLKANGKVSAPASRLLEAGKPAER